MEKSPEKKRIFPVHPERMVLGFFLLLALAAVFGLSSILSDVELEQGAIIVPGETPTPDFTLEDVNSGRRTFLNIPLLDAISAYVKFVFWGLIPISFFVFIFAPGSRWRRILVILMTLTGVITAVNLLRNFRAELGSSILGEMESFPAEVQEGTPIVAPTTSEPGQTLSLLISFILSVLVLTAGWLIWRWWKSKTPPRKAMAHEVDLAVQEINSGADLTQTVLQVYYRMNEILAEKAGINRQQAMTPREFELSLEDSGIPYQQVKLLTRLFEKARYGGMNLGEDSRKMALECLRIISSSLREFG